jgi:hypothetical protein
LEFPATTEVGLRGRKMAGDEDDGEERAGEADDGGLERLSEDGGG